MISLVTGRNGLIGKVVVVKLVGACRSRTPFAYARDHALVSMDGAQYSPSQIFLKQIRLHDIRITKDPKSHNYCRLELVPT